VKLPGRHSSNGCFFGARTLAFSRHFGERRQKLLVARHERRLAGGQEEAASARSSGFPSLSIGVQLMYLSEIAAFLDLRSRLCGNPKLGPLFQLFQCGSSHNGGAQTLRSIPDAGYPAVREEWICLRRTSMRPTTRLNGL
jgi:hypothetical protein